MKNEKLKIKRWEPLEKFRYYLFLVLKSRIFKSGKSTQLKRKESIFKEMEDFIGNKTREQCRSHHTKMIDYLRKRMGNKEVWELQLLLIYQFFKCYYTNRSEGVQKLVDELKSHLNHIIQQKTKFEERYESYLDDVEEIVQDLRLEDVKPANYNDDNVEVVVETGKEGVQSVQENEVRSDSWRFEERMPQSGENDNVIDQIQMFLN